VFLFTNAAGCLCAEWPRRLSKRKGLTDTLLRLALPWSVAISFAAISRSNCAGSETSVRRLWPTNRMRPSPQGCTNGDGTRLPLLCDLTHKINRHGMLRLIGVSHVDVPFIRQMSIVRVVTTLLGSGFSIFFRPKLAHSRAVPTTSDLRSRPQGSAEFILPAIRLNHHHQHRNPATQCMALPAPACPDAPF